MVKEYTKELIQEEFLQLLEEQAFNKITIAMLTQRCEISRNTFYYHYEDIYMLVKEILQAELARIDEEFNATASWEDSLMHAASFLLQNKRAAQNLFQSIDKKETDNYFYTICESVMTKYVENECRVKELAAKEDDKKLIAGFYRSALVGLLDEWIQNGMVEAPENIIKRIGFLFDGNIARSLKISANSDEEHG